MPIDMSVLITRRYPPGHMYQPDIRTEVRPLSEAPLLSMPYTSLFDDVVRIGEDMTERANREWAAGSPARMRAGQSLAGKGTLGVRVSPLDMPEEIRGSMVAVSI